MCLRKPPPALPHGPSRGQGPPPLAWAGSRVEPRTGRPPASPERGSSRAGPGNAAARTPQRPWRRGSGPAAPARSLRGTASPATRQRPALSRPSGPTATYPRGAAAEPPCPAAELPCPAAAAPGPGNRLSREPPRAQGRKRRRRRDLTRLAGQGGGARRGARRCRCQGRAGGFWVWPPRGPALSRREPPRGVRASGRSLRRRWRLPV